MRRMRWMTITATLALALVREAAAADHPLDGAKLTLRRSASGKQALTFIAKDPAILFPIIGSADDPSLNGALLELASTVEPFGAAFAMFAGVGTPGWRTKDASRDSYTYTNPPAAPGPMAVKVVTLKQGAMIKVVARGVGLALAGPQGAVGVRLTTGTLRNCALFDAPTIRKDEAGSFRASAATARLTDCASLVPGPTTTTTTTSTTSTTVFGPCSGGSPFPACGGACDVDETCLPTIDFTLPGTFACLCYPTTVTSCGASGYPTCGGACSGGSVCQAMTQDGSGLCACVDPAEACGSPGGPGSCQPGTCSPGQACRSVTMPVQLCGCGAP